VGSVEDTNTQPEMETKKAMISEAVLAMPPAAAALAIAFPLCPATPADHRVPRLRLSPQLPPPRAASNPTLGGARDPAPRHPAGRE
jgi:hypothetical protein